MAVITIINYYYNHRFMAIICTGQPALAYSPIKNSRILLEQSFTACMPLLMATSAFGLWRST